MNKQELIEELECIEVSTDSLDYLKGADYANERAINLAKQLDEPIKVVVPKFVAEYIEIRKRHYEVGGLGAAIIKVLRSCNETDLASWMNNNTEVFARAWLDGYEVEKEPLYHVLLSDKGATNIGYTFLNLAGTIDFTICKEKVDTLTENQIKAIDERYWPFAVKVEE